MSTFPSDEYDDLGVAAAQDDVLPVVKAVNRILAKALTEGASEIHIEPKSHGLEVWFRQHGTLRLAFPPLPAKVTPSVFNRIKAIANIATPSYKTLYEGRIQRQLDGQRYDCLVSLVPYDDSERIQLKVLSHSHIQPLDQLIQHPDSLSTLTDLLNQPQGLILVVGESGSGKATTMASLVMAQYQAGKKVCTLENPLKYRLPNIKQTAWHPSKGASFAESLQGVMADNPQLLMMGKLRDRAILISALDAAQHCVIFAALPTINLTESLAYLIGLGVDTSLITRSLLGIVSQRLLRQVCPDCAQEYHPSDEDIHRYGLPSDKGITCRQATVLESDGINSAQAGISACSTCGGMGYYQQIAVHEVLPITPTIRTLLEQDVDPTEIYRAAIVQDKITSLYAASVDLVRRGLTTLAEIDGTTYSPEQVEWLRQNEQPQEAETTPSSTAETDDIAEDIAETEGSADEHRHLDALADEADDGIFTEEVAFSDAIDLDALDAEDLAMDGMDLELEAASLDDWQDPDGEVVETSETSLPEDDRASTVTSSLVRDEGIVETAALDQPELVVENLEAGSEEDDDGLMFDPETSLDAFELSDDAEAEIDQLIHHDVHTYLDASSSPEELNNELIQVRKQLMETALLKADLQQSLTKQATELAAAQQQVQTLEQDKTDLKQQLVRERDELTRKFDRQQLDLYRKVKKDVVLRMLDALDSFEQANAQLSDEEQDSSIHKGYRAIYRLMVDGLKKSGVVAVESIGHPFNPEVHEAVMMEESSQYHVDTVVAEFRCGYMLDDIILRPAQVKVAVASDSKPEESSPPAAQTPEMAPEIVPIESLINVSDDEPSTSREKNSLASGFQADQSDHKELSLDGPDLDLPTVENSLDSLDRDQDSAVDRELEENLDSNLPDLTLDDIDPATIADLDLEPLDQLEDSPESDPQPEDDSDLPDIGLELGLELDGPNDEPNLDWPDLEGGLGATSPDEVDLGILGDGGGETGDRDVEAELPELSFSDLGFEDTQALPESPVSSEAEAPAEGELDMDAMLAGFSTDDPDEFPGDELDWLLADLPPDEQV